MKKPVVLGDEPAGWYEDERGFVGARRARVRANDLQKEIRRVQVKLRDCVEAEQKSFYREQLDKLEEEFQELQREAFAEFAR